MARLMGVVRYFEGLVDWAQKVPDSRPACERRSYVGGQENLGIVPQVPDGTRFASIFPGEANGATKQRG
jgi:hypothetical protein